MKHITTRGASKISQRYLLPHVKTIPADGIATAARKPRKTLKTVIFGAQKPFVGGSLKQNDGLQKIEPLRKFDFAMTASLTPVEPSNQKSALHFTSFIEAHRIGDAACHVYCREQLVEDGSVTRRGITALDHMSALHTAGSIA